MRKRANWRQSEPAETGGRMVLGGTALLSDRILRIGCTALVMLAAVGLSGRRGAAQVSSVIDSMDVLDFSVPAEKAKVEVAPGEDGTALRFSFDNDSKSVFSGLRLHPTAAWDRADGISFWVKGDGSSHLGGLEFIWNDDYGRRYGYAFPLNSTEWRKITVPWRDLIPEVGSMTKLIGGADGNAPSKLVQLSFGKWWYWKDYAAHSYTIDDIRLEPVIPTDGKTPRRSGDPLARVRAKLKGGLPITVVTMGDSLTDYDHWSNRTTNWPRLLSDKIKQKYGSTVTIVNPAMGGTTLRQNEVVMPRWLAEAPTPDLVTIFFGPNDWDGGMRGEGFYQAQRDVIERVRRDTGGRADVLIMTTRPPLQKGDDLAEMAEAGRLAARDENAGIADVGKAFSAMAAGERTPLYAWDKVHLGLAGQELVSQTVLGALAGVPAAPTTSVAAAKVGASEHGQPIVGAIPAAPRARRPRRPPGRMPEDVVIPDHPKSYYLNRTRAVTFADASGETLPYRLYVPSPLRAGEKYPLVFSLHGAGERGSDNIKQLSSYAAGWMDDAFQKEHPCFILVPQCPAGQAWVNYNNPQRSKAPDNPALKMAVEALEKVVDEQPVDRNRIYAIGASAGAAGTWDAIMHHPSLFAAALIVAGSGDPTGAAGLANLPIWVHFGSLDTAAKPQHSRDIVAALRQVHGKVQSTEYPDAGHEACYFVWKRKAVTDWLFAQRKGIG